MRVPPPLWVLAAVLAGTGLQRVLPLPRVPERMAVVVAIVLALAWLVIFVSSLRELRRAGTTVRPDRPTTALVTTGPYARTRNPLYVGLLLLQAAIGVWLTNLWILVLLVPMAALLTRLAIVPEERHLAATFGKSFAEYRARVPRWW